MRNARIGLRAHRGQALAPTGGLGGRDVGVVVAPPEDEGVERALRQERVVRRVAIP